MYNNCSIVESDSTSTNDGYIKKLLLFYSYIVIPRSSQLRNSYSHQYFFGLLAGTFRITSRPANSFTIRLSSVSIYFPHTHFACICQMRVRGRICNQFLSRNFRFPSSRYRVPRRQLLYIRHLSDDLIKRRVGARYFIAVRCVRACASVESASFKLSKQEIRPSSKQRISLAGDDLFDVHRMTAGDIRARPTCVRRVRVQTRDGDHHEP